MLICAPYIYIKKCLKGINFAGIKFCELSQFSLIHEIKYPQNLSFSIVSTLEERG